jgi:hypothetical protein
VGAYDALAAPGVEPPIDHVTQIAASGFTTCALKADGSVYCWGDEYGNAPVHIGI